MSVALLGIPFYASPQVPVRYPNLSGFYAHRGYNQDVFSKSDIHFKKDGHNGYGFALHNVVATYLKLAVGWCLSWPHFLPGTKIILNLVAHYLSWPFY
jgi:hypothetical protein